MKKLPREEQIRRATRQLFGDQIAATLDHLGIAALIQKHFPSCGCAKRRAKLNALHRKLTGRKFQ